MEITSIALGLRMGLIMIPSGYVLTQLLNMAIENWDLPIENGVSIHSYVKLPEGTMIMQ